MASSVTQSMRSQLLDAALNLGFTDIGIFEAPDDSVLRVEVHHGPMLYHLAFMDRNPRAIVHALQDISRKIEHNDRTNLDIRHNAVESFDDYVALLHKAREQNRRIDTVWITPEQKHILLADDEVLASVAQATNDQRLHLLGCALRVEAT